MNPWANMLAGPKPELLLSNRDQNRVNHIFINMMKWPRRSVLHVIFLAANVQFLIQRGFKAVARVTFATVTGLNTMVQPKLQPSGDVRRLSTDSGSHLLVLDAEAKLRDVVCRFLKQHGYQSLKAASVEEAAALLQEAQVVAILLDVRPTGHGCDLELLTQLRNQPALASTPAIVMTGGVLSDAEKGVVEECDGLLFYKPDGLTALLGYLHQITGRRQAN